MATIFTTKGMIDETELVRRETLEVDDDNIRQAATEYYLANDPTKEIVRRDVHVIVKKAAVEAHPVAASL